VDKYIHFLAIICWFICCIGVIIFVKIAQRRRASEGTYHPSRQEMNGPRVDLGVDEIKPPPEERLI